jgi:hypothetical protein
LEANWLCGEVGERDFDIIENGFYDWRGVGMEFYQSGDVQITCNHLIDCRRGVDIYRDDEPTGTSLRFRTNKIQALTSGADLFALRTNDAGKTKLGPNNVARGSNQLSVHATDTKFLFEGDSDSTETLNARYNYWFADGLLTDSDSIATRMAPDSTWAIDFSDFYDTQPPQGVCDPPDPPSQMLAGPRPGVAEGRPAVPVEGAGTLSLSSAYPNPVRSGVELDLAVPSGSEGLYVLEVYDVRGRQVLASERMITTPARYTLAWGGTDSAGGRAAAGIYFLRLRGPGGFQETRKVTLVR